MGSTDLQHVDPNVLSIIFGTLTTFLTIINISIDLMIAIYKYRQHRQSSRSSVYGDDIEMQRFGPPVAKIDRGESYGSMGSMGSIESLGALPQLKQSIKYEPTPRMLDHRASQSLSIASTSREDSFSSPTASRQSRSDNRL